MTSLLLLQSKHTCNTVYLAIITQCTHFQGSITTADSTPCRPFLYWIPSLALVELQFVITLLSSLLQRQQHQRRLFRSTHSTHSLRMQPAEVGTARYEQANLQFAQITTNLHLEALMSGFWGYILVADWPEMRKGEKHTGWKSCKQCAQSTVGICCENDDDDDGRRFTCKCAQFDVPILISQ